MNLGNQVDGYNKVYNNFKKNSKIKLGTQSIPFSHSVLQDKRNGKVASVLPLWYSRLCISNHFKAAEMVSQAFGIFG